MVCRRSGLSPFQPVAVSVCHRFDCTHNGLYCSHRIGLVWWRMMPLDNRSRLTYQRIRYAHYGGIGRHRLPTSRQASAYKIHPLSKLTLRGFPLQILLDSKYILFSPILLDLNNVRPRWKMKFLDEILFIYIKRSCLRFGVRHLGVSTSSLIARGIFSLVPLDLLDLDINFKVREVIWRSRRLRHLGTINKYSINLPPRKSCYADLI